MSSTDSNIFSRSIGRQKLHDKAAYIYCSSVTGLSFDEMPGTRRCFVWDGLMHTAH